MKILYVLPFVPWPVRVRSFNLIPRLARRHEIHLLCLTQSDQERARLDGLGQRCGTTGVVSHSRFRALLQAALALPKSTPMRIAYCGSEAMRAAVSRRIAELQPDVIYVERWRALQYVPEDTRIPVVCDPTDSMILYNRRLVMRGAWWEKLIGLEEYVKFRTYEPRLARRGTVTIFCSQHDLDAVRLRAPKVRYAIIPNGVDCQQFHRKRPEEEEADTLVFAGNLGYRPNLHAVEFFLRKIFPLIRSRVPNCRFIVVGNQASKASAKYGNPRGLAVIDFVPELRPYLARATVSVAPITVGAGVSNKLLEAFATGTPIVATPLACGDLPVTNGEHLLIAESSEIFAERVVDLLRDPKLRGRLADHARALVEQRYNWEIVAAQMEELMIELVSKSRTRGEVQSIDHALVRSL